MSFIDAQLYRNLKDGKEYERLIPVYKGTEHNFDKEADNSNTYDTLRYMSEWAYKYAYQMKDVAPLLKGRSLQETVNKIYTFLYSHFQYKLDGSTQNLYSPSAAWRFRTTGFDCKTYSILCSTILQNLGIPHSFRMVQQAGIMPGEWSHVYVIVPNGNTHLVIDATTHTNKEVSYTNKHDYTMKHRGLASPYVGALGCACQGTPIRSNGLGSPSTLANTIKNFHVFLDQLEKQGISKEVTARMLTIVRANVDNGIDPVMGDVLKKALATTSSLGYTFDPLPSLSPAGSTYSGYSTSIPTSNYVTPTTQTAFGSAFSGIQAQGMSALSNISVGGINVAGLATDLATGNFVGAGLSVLKAIIPMEKTFGAVFANGFDLSCWNSAYSEQKAKIDLEKDLPYMKQWSGIYTNPTTESLDKFQFITEIYLDHAKDGQASKYVSCTRKGGALREKGVLELRKNVYEEFTSQGFVLTPNGKKNNSFANALPGKTDTSTNYKTARNGYDSFTVTNPKQQAAQQAAQLAAQQAQIQAQQIQAQQIQQAVQQGVQQAQPAPAAAKSSSSTPLLLGAGLLALKLLL